jgi:hypothetical protein
MKGIVKVGIERQHPKLKSHLELELELELIQTHMAQKPLLWV